ncbi:MAG: SprT-like family protein [Planctomycetota bacterium]|nr:SprT-like family protein [Planctomycetota bacterium]
MELLNSIKSRTERNCPGSQSRKRTAQIYWNLQKSGRFRSAQFSRIEESDLEEMFHLYDALFFDNEISSLLKQLKHPLSFRLSGKMTRAGGKTTREESWDGRRLIDRKYEIAISTTLLFQTFKSPGKPVIVTGVECSDRLQALQRIMEHELIHLVEMMVWYHSDCFRNRFKAISNRLFCHTESTHQLTTVDERALREFGIQAGDSVSFSHGGQRYRGIVNRITKRATILVPSSAGELFSDGKRYARFYVPIEALRLDRKKRIA